MSSRSFRLRAVSDESHLATFGSVLAEAMRRQGLTYRELATATRRVDPTGKGLTHPYLVQLANGTTPLTAPALRLIAAALSLDEGAIPELRAATVVAAFSFQDLPPELLRHRLERLDRLFAAEPDAYEDLGIAPPATAEVWTREDAEARAKEILDEIEPKIAPPDEDS